MFVAVLVGGGVPVFVMVEVGVRERVGVGVGVFPETQME